MATDRSFSDQYRLDATPVESRRRPIGDAIVWLARAMAHEATVEGACRSCLEALQELFDPRTSFIAVHDRATDQLVVTAARGRADPRVVASRSGEGPQGEAFETGRLVWLAPARRGGRGLCAVPMIAAGRPVGVVILIAPQVAATGPSDEERGALEAASTLAAGAVRAQHLRDEAERHSREQQSSAEALKIADRDRDQHLSHISHELRTPLTTVKAYIEMALREMLGPITERQRKGFEVALRNADRLLRLINDLILTARLRAGQMTLDPRPMGLRAVFEEALNLLESDLSSAGLTVALAGGSDAFVRGNRDRLVEASVHMLEHAIHCGGPIHARVEAQGREGVLTVDAGEGPAALLPDGEGDTGVLIVRRILDLHGGSLDAQRGPRSISLRATLPLYAGAVDQAAAVKARQGAVLVVEDDADCRDVLVDALREAGYTVHGVADGTEALEHLRRDQVALVLLDLMLPTLDGEAVLRAIRGDPAMADLPVFVISGAVDAPAGHRAAWGERVDGVFEKPLQFQWLLERVRERVAKP